MQSNKARFSDKVAIVIGASNENSIGGAIAARLIQEGARVIITARTAEKVDAVASKIGAVGEVCEIADERQVSELAEKAIERYGRLDVAVNCAGLALMGYIESTSEEVLRDAFEKEVPLGRLSTTEDVAAATAWVCSDEAYMTGQNLQINGGLSLRRLPTMKELGLS